MLRTRMFVIARQGEENVCNVSLTLRGRPPLSPRSFELRNGFEAPPFFSSFFFFCGRRRKLI